MISASFSSFLKQFLAYPLARGMDLDDPATTVLRKRILEEKRFLRRLYEEWYQTIAAEVPPGDGPVLELGSGAGFLERFVPRVITSDIFQLPGLSLVLDAHRIPFREDALRSIVMVDVLHHLSDVRRFFQEASRCVHPGGAMVMIEPWVSTWSTFVYQKLHHEPFEPQVSHWEFLARGPLSGANGALSWMVFERDRREFEGEFPQWRIRRIKPHMPFCYVVSGGMTWRSLVPAAMYPVVRRMENGLAPWMHRLAMFALIVLERR